MNIDEILRLQKDYFLSGATLPIKNRVENLKKLYSAIKKYESEIKDALKSDLGKSDYEAFMCEIGLALTEITYMIKNVRKFAKEKNVFTPLAHFVSRSYTKPSPYGNVLIMNPWNYPFLLAIEPLTDALAAGNTVVLKPSAYSPATTNIIKKIVEECFSPELVSVVTGGREQNASLLKKKFDMVFFTGSTNVGKEVLRNCAETLTPAVLELGGKSPCIVDETADIKLSATRIVFGKYLNCGQTCVAPDYILCHEKVKDKFVSEVKKQIIKQFGENPIDNDDYGKIINQKHFDRLCSLIDAEKVIFGGGSEVSKLKIEPTVMDNVNWNDRIMQEEIFGPIMPILTFDDFEQLPNLLSDKPKPLAFYIFSNDKKRIKDITERCAFGGGCVNDTVIHLATSEMGFSGVGESGMGSYHGLDGFNAFSHTKSIVDKKTWLDLPMRYQPYDRKLFAKILKLILR